ncbi:acyl-CoA dehydrogenase family protein [Paenarthrobacter nitroguajacolicus]|uniref:acyl-CoA dehydrogenase family protein n=1 Tax=Paenarthrobacter nitroguajacolicus TaxID=211146 RepID=UPI0028629891|nr:acyl-CoA dehydrogenase family protein [Paenarthrobacter nitroguajacolicus]MDR6637050.1 alkylation response protein AidB-like acyl-CoA dehydrogenase [Paenarthrobacter nitroguajacolicus]
MTSTEATTDALGSVLALIEKRRQEFQQQRHVPRDVVVELKKAGIYRAAAPRCFGGDALPPAEFLRTIERIATVDASAAWVASFGAALVYLAALPMETQAELYREGPDLAFAGGLFPVHDAPIVDGLHRVSGTWKFASGSKGADIYGVGIRGGEASNGKPLTAVLRPDEVTIKDNWDVIGLRGTGSHDLVVEKAAVAPEWTFVRGGEPTVDEPLYHYPTVAYAAQVLAVVNVGLGRAALDYSLRVGSGRTGITNAPKLADRAYYRIDLAKAEADLRSARSFFYEITEETYATVVSRGAATDQQKALLRLAATHAAKAGARAVHSAYSLSGTAAIYDGHPLQDYLRDASVVTQHAFLGDGMYDATGAVLMGLPPAVPGFL